MSVKRYSIPIAIAVAAVIVFAVTALGAAVFSDDPASTLPEPTPIEQRPAPPIAAGRGEAAPIPALRSPVAPSEPATADEPPAAPLPAPEPATPAPAPAPQPAPAPRNPFDGPTVS